MLSWKFHFFEIQGYLRDEIGLGFALITWPQNPEQLMPVCQACKS